MITTQSLMKCLAENPNLNYHLSLKQINPDELLEVYQTLIDRWQCKGRPLGIYYGKGDSWLDYILKNPTQTMFGKSPCCYLYLLKLDKDKILQINSKSDINKLKKDYGTYFINHLGINVCGTERGYKGAFPYEKLHRFSKTSKNMASAFKKAKIIFTDKNKYIDEIERLKEESPEEFSNIIIGREFGISDDLKLPRWDRVSKKYDGVEFYPYLKDVDDFWYQALSVGSGTIWNPDAIEEMVLIAKKIDDANELWELTQAGQRCAKYLGIPVL